jgi:uncharacterized protein (DUF1499 family)
MEQTMNAQRSPGAARLGNWVVAAGLVVALASATAMVFSGIGYRLDLWHFRTGFLIMTWAFWFAVGATLFCVAGVVLGRAKPPKLLAMAFAGIVIGGVSAYLPWSWKQAANSLPYIHDITTDTQNPPAFVAAAKLRKEGDHPVAYDGPEVASKQKEAYPDLAPLVTTAPKEKVFEAAKAAIAAMGMTLADADLAQGRIEANQTSLLYGFTDDMVVRIASGADGTKVDVRSKSRLGRSDLGQNAKRIRVFLAKLRVGLS